MGSVITVDISHLAGLYVHTMTHVNLRAPLLWQIEIPVSSRKKFENILFFF
jgi:hypothetical protein